jgi:toxin-antitoxin system PIN domain toxin
MKHLCDSNVFLALALEAHPHHQRAVSWLESRPAGTRLYFCRATQTSFLRLLTISEWLKENVCTNDEAMAVYEELRSDARVGFLENEPAQVEKQWFDFARSGTPAPKRWMDAYLAAFARTAKISFVTFDRGFADFPDLDVIILTT